MSNAQISIRIDAVTKQTISSFADSLGLSTGAFLVAAARDAIDRGSVTLRASGEAGSLMRDVKKARQEYGDGHYTKTSTKTEALDHLRNLAEKPATR